MNFLLLSLLAIQAGAAAASGLNLWPQVAAVPPGTNTTAVTETVATHTPQNPPATPGNAPQAVAAPSAVIILPSAGAIQQPTAPTTGVRALSQPGFPGTQAPGAPSRAISGGASTGTTGSSLPAGAARPAQTKLLHPDAAHAPAEAAAGLPGQLAAAPGRIIIGLERGRAPRSRRLVLWTVNGEKGLTVSAQQGWIEIGEGRQRKKGTRVYDITIDPATLPPGRLHDGVICVGSSTGWLDIPVTVELHTTH